MPVAPSDRGRRIMERLKEQLRFRAVFFISRHPHFPGTHVRSEEKERIMSNPIYALTDHTEEELAPWLAECGTGDPMVDGLVLTALDCAWGHWARASKKPRRPFSDPEYLKAVAGLPWRWDDWIPAGLFSRGLNAAWWGRLVAAMDDLGRFGLSDTAIVRRQLMEPFGESVLAIRDPG